MSKKIKAKEVMRLEDILPTTKNDVVMANGSKECPICGDLFLYGRSTKRTCGDYRCARLNRLKNKQPKTKEIEAWQQIRLILEEVL